MTFCLFFKQISDPMLHCFLIPFLKVTLKCIHRI